MAGLTTNDLVMIVGLAVGEGIVFGVFMVVALLMLRSK
jgi:tetrahydromethanopterin S-methyltransferase subunit F